MSFTRGDSKIERCCFLEFVKTMEPRSCVEIGSVEVFSSSRVIPTEDDWITVERDGVEEALMVASSPAGSVITHPRGRIVVFLGPIVIGDGNEMDKGLVLEDEGMIAFE